MKYGPLHEDSAYQQVRAEHKAVVKKFLPRAALALIAAALILLGLGKWAILPPLLLDGISIVLPALMVYGIAKLSGMRFRH